MSSDRPNLTLDEQSFQGLLSAAFIIQQHNDRRKLAREPQAEPEAHIDSDTKVDSEANVDLETSIDPDVSIVCPHCGALKSTEGSPCERCGLDELRPGERLQRNWASMWLMSQEQSLWPERSPEIGEAVQGEAGQKDVASLAVKHNPRTQTARDFAASNFLAVPVANKVTKEAITQEETDTQWATAATENEAPEDFHFPSEEAAPEDSDLTFQPFELSAGDDSPADDSSADSSPSDEASIDAADASPRSLSSSSLSLLQRLADLRITLRFRRADLYLGAAVFVAAFALLWPAASAPRRAALGPFERLLVTLGIAEAPAPVVHLTGDPGIEVWVDTHTALYYCPGEEPYGKTPNGRFSSQREAQMDRFEPSSRSACE
jgi:ribosomal protein L40E